VLYAGSNGWPYKSIGRLLVAEGRLPLAAVNMATIRQYLFSHLDERRHILHYNDRYIFFRLAPATGEEPLGAMGRALTPGRSVALDAACFPLGSLAYLATEVPRFAGGRLVGWHNMRRFVLAQDRGAAIRGSGRLDMFWGHGSDAGKIAGEMRQPGKLYILIKKQGAAL
jgi:membrane-bound lytic murein transglycosylase A